MYTDAAYKFYKTSQSVSSPVQCHVKKDQQTNMKHE